MISKSYMSTAHDFLLSQRAGDVIKDTIDDALNLVGEPVEQSMHYYYLDVILVYYLGREISPTVAKWEDGLDL